MIKIFVQNKPLFLVDTPNAEVDDYLHRQTTIFLDELNTSAVKTMLHQLQQPEFYAGVLMHNHEEQSLEAFKSHLQVIVAAGGLVETNDKQFLLIFRKGKWDLPKGKLDEGEDLKTCALREIEEETGANKLKIEKDLVTTYHTYYEGDKHILKESHWYLVNAAEKSSLKPQTDEDIEKCEWVDLEKLPSYMANMHASIIDVIQLRLNQLKQKI